MKRSHKGHFLAKNEVREVSSRVIENNDRVRHPRKMDIFSSIESITETSVEENFKTCMRNFLEDRARNNCSQLEGHKESRCTCLKNLLSTENVIDRLVNRVTNFWLLTPKERKEQFKKQVDAMLDEKTNPNFKSKEKLFCLREDIESDGDPLNNVLDYKVCLAAYLSIFGKGYYEFKALRKQKVKEISENN